MTAKPRSFETFDCKTGERTGCGTLWPSGGWTMRLTAGGEEIEARNWTMDTIQDEVRFLDEDKSYIAAALAAMPEEERGPMLEGLGYTLTETAEAVAEDEEEGRLDAERRLATERAAREAAERECEKHDLRRREGRQLLRRLVKYIREDRAVTPGSTRLTRLVAEVDAYLARSGEPNDVLR